MFKHATKRFKPTGRRDRIRQPMYCIRVSNTQMKVPGTHASWRLLTACRTFIVGTGTSYVHFHLAAQSAAFNGGKGSLDTTVRLSDGMQPYTRDTWPGEPRRDCRHWVADA